MDPLIIDFPKKYAVKAVKVEGKMLFDVSVPKDHITDAAALLKQQPWITSVLTGYYLSASPILVTVSLAYDISEEQAIEALSRLCEHIISPPVEIDADLAADLEALV